MQNYFPLPPYNHNHLPLTDKLHWSKTRAKFDAAISRASKSIKETANVGQLMLVNVEPEDIAGTGAALGDVCKITVGGVNAPINSMAGGALEAIGGEMMIANINVGGNAETELNDASMGTKAQKMGIAATKNNGNGVVYDGLLPTNFGKTGMYKKVLLVLCCQA